jgi:hypothetical protein
MLRTLRDRIYARTTGYRFGGVLILLLATFIFLSAAPPLTWAELGSVLLVSAAVLAAVVASRASLLFFRIAVVVIVVSIVTTCVALAVGTNPDVPVGTLMGALLTVGVPVTIVRGLWERRIVDLHTVLGALAVYVSIGLFFAYVFSSIHGITGRAVFAQHVTESSADFVYFSFVTIATVGYGDLTAAGGLSRALAALEGMTGQLYLVTVVALLVTNLRPRMATRSEAPRPNPDET